MRLFGNAAETPIERERRERDEAEHRKNRDAAVDAHRRGAEREAKRKEAKDRVEEQRQAHMQSLGDRLHPPQDDGPEARAARTEAAQRAGEAEMDRRRRVRAFRDQAVQGALGARNAKEAAFEACDLETYIEAASLFTVLDALVDKIDSAERARQGQGAHPSMIGRA